jgi:Putative RNA methylase family UPF0020
MLIGYGDLMATGLSCDPFGAYRAYDAELQRLLFASSVTDSDIAAHLDGMAYHRLRQIVPLEARRNSSTFFTSTETRARLVGPYRTLIARGASILDPACGVGDLLIAASAFLPRTWTETRRYEHLAARFYGVDLIPVLVSVARKRLQLAMRPHQVDANSGELTELRLIRSGDGLSSEVPYDAIQLLLLNPPFKRVTLPRAETWGEGLTCEAAPFVLNALERCNPGTYAAAILPDVLRSGSRYAKWRGEVERLAKISAVEIIGVFDPWTDVDVFILRLRVRDVARRRMLTGSDKWCLARARAAAQTVLGDVATISIGDVVPHRHQVSGPTVPYLSVPSTPIGETITSAPTRQFLGRLHEPPFVLLRRTSAPTRGGRRLAPSIVDGIVGAAAIENHLIVVKPHDQTLATCEKLVDELVRPEVTHWLDARLRTRHLTKSALSQVPLSGWQGTAANLHEP